MRTRVTRRQPQPWAENRIRYWRELHGLSRNDLAARLPHRTSKGATHFQTVLRLESGKLGLDLWWLWHLADALGVPPVRLLPESFSRVPARHAKRPRKHGKRGRPRKTG